MLESGYKESFARLLFQLFVVSGSAAMLFIHVNAFKSRS